MATRRKLSEDKEVQQPKSDYIEFKLPKIDAHLLRYVILILLLGLAFFAGYQTSKVTYWEQKEKSLASLTTGGAGQPTPTPAFYKVTNGHLPILGKKDAKVTIVEFSDLQCLFCRRFWKDTLPQIKKDYIDKGLVKLVFRQYPLPADLHPAARPLAEAAECANEQGKFWEFHDKSQAEQAAKGEGTIPVSNDDITAWAADLGLDTAKFSDCFSTAKYTKNIDKDMAEGNTVNVSSTPTFYINGQIVVGAVPYNTFKTIIDQQLKK